MRSEVDDPVAARTPEPSDRVPRRRPCSGRSSLVTCVRAPMLGSMPRWADARGSLHPPTRWVGETLARFDPGNEPRVDALVGPVASFREIRCLVPMRPSPRSEAISEIARVRSPPACRGRELTAICGAGRPFSANCGRYTDVMAEHDQNALALLEAAESALLMAAARLEEALVAVERSAAPLPPVTVRRARGWGAMIQAGLRRLAARHPVPALADPRGRSSIAH